MGLDSVEILMEVENAFGIKIPDIVAEKIVTVGDFHNTVWKHLEGRQVDTCHSQVLFYRLRSELAVRNKLNQSYIKPASSPESFWPVENRKQAYKQFEKEFGLNLPPLMLPGPWSKYFEWFSLILLVGSLIIEFILISFFHYSNWIWLGTLALVFIIAAVSKLVEPFRTKVGVPDMREFTRQVLKANYKELAGNAGTNRVEMEAVINQIIADKVGLDISEVTAEKHIADDLGVD